MPEIVILGAGLTGISAAYHLEQAGFFDYKIFEKNNRPGGLLQSVQQDGFTFDYTGHLLHISDPYIKTFIEKILGFSHFDFIQRSSAIFSHKTFVDYPFQMNLHGLPHKIIVQCLQGFINRRKSHRHPNSFYEWVLKYFGSGIGTHFFFPYNKKLLAYDVKNIHHSWTGRFVPQTNLQTLLYGALSKTNELIGYNSSFYYPKNGGIEILIKALIATLKNKIETQHNAMEIDFHAKTICFENGHKEHFTHLISTIPLDHLLTKSNNTQTTLKAASKKLLCNSVINLNIGFNRTNISDKHWIYFPEKQFPFYRIGFWHNISASSVKTGHSAIYGETSYLAHTMTEKQKENLIKKSLDKTLEFLQLNSSHVVINKTLHLKHAYVIYDFWREKNLNKIHNRLHEFNIHSIGRFGAWKYSSMQEAILEGKDVATKILSLLKHTISNNIVPAITASHEKQIARKQPKNLLCGKN
ncbi:MAG: FAD-dependent oxidoreductase [bacterium]